MFAGIVPRYDLMNRLMTAGLDRRWRAPGGRRGGGRARRPRARRLLRHRRPGAGARATCIRPARSPASTSPRDAGARARQGRAPRAIRAGDAARSGSLTFVRGDLLTLPFADGAFAAVTVGWGVRNVPDVPRAFAEMARVTRARRPGGMPRVDAAAARPGPPLPRRLVRARGAAARARSSPAIAPRTAYLPASVAAFPRADELAAIMADAGLRAGALPPPRLRRRGPARGRGARREAGRRVADAGARWRSAARSAATAAPWTASSSAWTAVADGYPGELGEACRAHARRRRQARAAAAHAAGARSDGRPRRAGGARRRGGRAAAHGDPGARRRARRAPSCVAAAPTVVARVRRADGRVGRQLPARARVRASSRHRRRRAPSTC